MIEKFSINNTETVETPTATEKIPEKKEVERNGVLININNFLSRHPKLIKLFIVLELGVLAEQQIKKYNKLELPDSVNDAQVSVETSRDDENLMRDLRDEVGNFSMDLILRVDSVNSIEERKEVVDLPDKNRVHGFEKFKLSNDEISTIIEETLPKGFDRNLNTISFVNEFTSLPTRYTSGLFEGSQEAAHASRSDKTIEVVKGAERSSKEWIANDMISHEVFHLQDWASNRLLTLSERLDLFKKVIERVKSDDRFKSPYVEMIKNNDKRDELDIKATEYFAEIGSAYLSKDYNLLPQADKDLIHDFIQKTDPEFNRKEAIKLRYDLIGESPFTMSIPPFEEILEKERKSTENYIMQAEGMLRVRLKEVNEFITDIQLDNRINEWKAKEMDLIQINAKRWYEKMSELNIKLKQDFEKKFN